MSKRRTYNWPQLFAEFEQSGLSQVNFCKQHDINPRYFSLKLSKRKAQECKPFTQVAVQSEPAALSPGIILEVGRCKIHCPFSLSTHALASLVKSLA